MTDLDKKNLAEEFLSIEAACLNVVKRCENARKKLNVGDRPVRRTNKKLQRALEKREQRRIKKSQNFQHNQDV